MRSKSTSVYDCLVLNREERNHSHQRFAVKLLIRGLHTLGSAVNWRLKRVTVTICYISFSEDKMLLYIRKSVR